VKSLEQNTNVEDSKCGSCRRFEKDCPHETTRDIGKVYPFFAEKCSSFEEKES